VDEWISEEAQSALNDLTPQQAMGAIRIAQAAAEGRGVNSLLSGPAEQRICARSTYYGRTGRPGWSHQEPFRRAVALAKRDLVAWLAENAGQETLQILRACAPQAARELQRQLAGDPVALEALIEALDAPTPEERRLAADMLGAAGHGAAAEPLRERLAVEQDEKARAAILTALGLIARADSVNAQRAANSVLDRATVETATKATHQVQVDELPAEERAARIAALLEAARTRRDGGAVDDPD
jgi:hypothetical protein